MKENGGEGLKQVIHHEGDLGAVFRDIEKFKDEVNNGKGIIPERGPLLLVGPGTQLGVFSGGGVRGIKKLGLANAFKTLAGVSTGGPVVSYLASDQPEIGTEIYSGPNTGDEFINLRRALKGGSLVDIDWLCNENFRKGERKLDVEKMRMNVADIFYGVTRLDNGEGVFVNAKKLQDPIEGLRGSCAIPEMYLGEVNLKSAELGEQAVRVVDGGVALPMPVIKSIEQFQPTSILIFANRPKKHRDTLVDLIERRYDSLVVDKDIADKILNQEEEFWKNIDFLKDCGIPYTIVWTDESIKSTEKNVTKLKNAANNFETYMIEEYKKSLAV